MRVLSFKAILRKMRAGIDELFNSVVFRRVFDGGFSILEFGKR